MPTVEEIARHVAGIVGTDIDLLLVGEWVARRWQEVANSTTLRALRKTGELVIPAPTSTGTVTTTLDSTAVTGSGTTWTQNLVGQHFRNQQNWYEIAAVPSATSLTLVSHYSEDTIADSGYNIVQRRHNLSPEARKLGTFVHMRLRRSLSVSSQIGMNLFQPSRFELNSVPQFVSEMEPTTDGTRRVEIYPYSKNQELIHYLYWAKPQFLAFNDYIPGDIDTEALREGVLIDMYRNLANKAAMDNKIEVAAYYRNESRSQETAWRNVHKKRLLQQDDGLDDLEFILMNSPTHPRSSEERGISTAYDQVWYT